MAFSGGIINIMQRNRTGLLLGIYAVLALLFIYVWIFKLAPCCF
jgi:hypothetical protein